MEYEKRGVSLDLFVRGPKHKIIESFIQSNLDYTKSMDYDRDSDYLHMTFSDESVLEIHDANSDTDSDEEVLHLTYWPGDKEHNFDTSEELLNEIPKLLDDFEISLRGFKLGIVVSRPEEAILEYTNLESGDEFKALAFDRGDLRYEIMEREDGSYRIFCKSENVDLEKLNEKKRKLFDNTEAVVDVS